MWVHVEAFLALAAVVADRGARVVSRDCHTRQFRARTQVTSQKRMPVPAGGDVD